MTSDATTPNDAEQSVRHGSAAPRPDPDLISDRSELGAALTALRESAGLSVRELVEQSDGFLGTVSGWLSGVHAPTAANRDLFERVLRACGTDPADFPRWWAAVSRARIRSRSKNAGNGSAVPPYPGFAAFESTDHERFFGRSEESLELVSRILSAASGTAPRIVIVVGASGVGKSSVVRAGLAGRITDGTLAGWETVIHTPGKTPTESLADADAALGQIGDRNAILIIDQFEEIWTQQPQPGDAGDAEDAGDPVPAADFAAAVLARTTGGTEPGDGPGDTGDGTGARTGTVVAVIVIRSDFLDRLVAEPGYARAVTKSAVAIGPMDEPALREAIEGPAKRYGVKLEPGLVELMLSDVAAAGNPAGALPLLAHTLLTTWETSGKRTMTVAGYLRTGRLAGAVETSAESVYQQSGPEERVVLQRLLLDLVNVADGRITRRIATAEELGLAVDGAEQTPAALVLARLLAARLVTVDDDGIQLTHEALVRAWPRFTEWVATDADRLRLKQRIHLAADLWEHSGREQNMLLSSGAVDLIDTVGGGDTPLNWNAAERDLIARSTEHRAEIATATRRRVRQLRVVATVAVICAVVAAMAATAAGVALVTTQRARSAADRAHSESLSRQLALESRRLLPRDSAVAAQLAVIAYRTAPTAEALSNLLNLSSSPPAARRIFPGPVQLAAAPSGSMLAVRQDARVDLYRVTAEGLGDHLGGVAIPSGRMPGAGLEFTPSGRSLLIGTGDGLVDVATDAPSRPVVRGITVPTAAPIVRLSPSADGGTMIASLDNAPPVLLRRAAANWTATPLPVPAADFRESQAGVALSADGAVAAVSVPGGGITIWDLTGAAPVQAGRVPLDGSSNQAIRMTFAGRTLAAGLRSREALVIDVADPRAPRVTNRIDGYTSYVNDVRFTDDAHGLLTASSDGSVRLTDLTGATPDLTFTAADPVGEAVLVDHTVLAAESNGTVLSWPRRRSSATLGPKSIFQIPIDRDSVLLAANGGPDSQVAQWRVDPGPVLSPAGPNLVPPPGQRFSGAVSVSTDGDTAALGTATGRVYLADLRDRLHPLLSPVGAQAMNSLVEAVILAPDGAYALAGGLSTTELTLIDSGDPAAPKVVGRVQTKDGVPTIGFLGPRRAVAGTAGGDLDFVDLGDPTAPRIRSVHHMFKSEVGSVAVSPDGRTLLAAAGAGGEMALLTDFDGAAEHPRIHRFQGPSGAVYAVAWSPDGARFAAVTSAGEVWVYEPTGPDTPPRRLITFTVDDTRLFDLRFADDGATLVASGDQGRLLSWDLDPADVISRVCASGSDPITRAEWARLAPDEDYRSACP